MVSRRDWLRLTGFGLASSVLGARAAAQDPRKEQGRQDDMVLIPAGPFVMGTTQRQAEELADKYGYHPSWLSGEVPQRRVVLSAFEIDRFPVTNRQYAEFCAATGHRPPRHWRGGEPPGHLLDHPVLAVNALDAKAYAEWAGKRLPAEAEWEKAARGEEGLLFPWGNDFDPEACCWNRQRRGGGPRTAPVDAHPRGASPYGVMDMVGNVAEWCGDGPRSGVSYIKGGCWATEDVINLRPAARNMSGFSLNALNFYGFRCVRDVR